MNLTGTFPARFIYYLKTIISNLCCKNIKKARQLPSFFSFCALSLFCVSFRSISLFSCWLFSLRLFGSFFCSFSNRFSSFFCSFSNRFSSFFCNFSNRFSSFFCSFSNRFGSFLCSFSNRFGSFFCSFNNRFCFFSSWRFFYNFLFEYLRHHTKTLFLKRFNRCHFLFNSF